jgi:hypothetical protein
MLKIGAVQSTTMLIAAALHKRYGSGEWRKHARRFPRCGACFEPISEWALVYVNSMHDAWARKFGTGVPLIEPSGALVRRLFAQSYDLDFKVNLCLEFEHDTPLPHCITIYEWAAHWSPCLVALTSDLQPWHYVVYAGIPLQRAKVILALLSRPRLPLCRTERELREDINVALLHEVYMQYCFHIGDAKQYVLYIQASGIDRLHLSRVAVAQAAMSGAPLRNGEELNKQLQKALDAVKNANATCVQLSELYNPYP